MTAASIFPPIDGGAYRCILLGDSLLLTEFGRDTLDYLREAGFKPEVRGPTTSRSQDRLRGASPRTTP
jgi:hypothetical protein